MFYFWNHINVSSKDVTLSFQVGTQRGRIRNHREVSDISAGKRKRDNYEENKPIY